ncbi:MAG: hypothetical protein ABW101_10790 [Candidatus Thiodiazotropha sp.]
MNESLWVIIKTTLPMEISMTISQSLYDPCEDSLDAAIELLTSIEPTDVGITSCYIDIESGIDASLEEITAEAKSIGSDLDETARYELDDALSRIKVAVCEEQEPEVRGLAIFSRSMIGGRFWQVIPTSLPFRNQLTYYRVPDVRPLLSLRDVCNEQFVVWSTSGGVELLRFGGGSSRTLAWMAESQMQRPEVEALESPVLKPIIGAGHRRFHTLARNTLSRVLRPVRGLHLVLAGDPARLEQLGKWLPGSMLSSVRQRIPVSPYLSRHKALRQIADHAASGVRDAVDAFANACLRFPHLSRSCVSGANKTLSALCSRSLELLFISGEKRFLSSRKSSSGKSKRAGLSTRSGRLSGNTGIWHAEIELSRLACQLQVPVLVTHATQRVLKDGVGGIHRNQYPKAVETCHPRLAYGCR